MPIDSETSRRNRRSSIARAALAVLAFLGIGPGATTAMWSDNVWFTSAVSTKTFNLQGSVTSASARFEESATEGAITLTIPNTILAGIEPSKIISTKIWAKNAGTADAKMAAPAFTLVGATNGLTITNATTGLAVSSTGLAAIEVLAAGAVKEITVTITAGAVLVQGGAGNLHIQLSGQSLS